MARMSVLAIWLQGSLAIDMRPMERSTWDLVLPMVRWDSAM